MKTIKISVLGRNLAKKEPVFVNLMIKIRNEVEGFFFQKKWECIAKDAHGRPPDLPKISFQILTSVYRQFCILMKMKKMFE